VTVGNLVEGVKEQFNLVAANISSEAVMKLLDGIGGVLAENAVFICSGIVEESKSRVAGKIKTRGFEIVEVRTKEDWVAIAARLVHPF